MVYKVINWIKLKLEGRVTLESKLDAWKVHRVSNGAWANVHRNIGRIEIGVSVVFERITNIIDVINL